MFLHGCANFILYCAGKVSVDDPDTCKCHLLSAFRQLCIDSVPACCGDGDLATASDPEEDTTGSSAETPDDLYSGTSDSSWNSDRTQIYEVHTWR